MSEHGEQCPFLNRSDPRCSEHLSLEHLQNAFRFCFGAFATCPKYAQLVSERRVRRGGTRRDPWEESLHDRSGPVVQVTIAGRIEKPLTSAA
jgi:hypothetical protein